MEQKALRSPRDLGDILAAWSAIPLPPGDSLGGKLIPDLYMALPEEEDFDALLRRIHQTLKETGLLSFEGPMPTYSYFLELLERDGRFLSSQDFFDIYRKNLCHMGRPFKGILGIEITDWVERRGTSAQKFGDFMTFLQTIDKDVLIVFLSTCLDQNKNEEAFLDLLHRFRLERAGLGKGVQKEDFLSFLLERLASGGTEVKEEARPLLEEIAAFVLSARGNQGLDSARRLAEDIRYECLLQAKEGRPVLTKEIAALFLPGGEWAEAFRLSSERGARVGRIGLI